jgi:pyruvate dehydrogenase E1 component alpha subunit
VASAVPTASAPPAILELPYTPEGLGKQIGPEWVTLLRSGYRWMTLARVLDARMLGLQRQGRIGFYGPATGQEAVSVAAGLASRVEDWILPGLREQLVALVRGHPLENYVHHLFANDHDAAKGRQMPCHPTAKDVHYVSMSSVVGTQISHAVGVAYAMKARRADTVVLGFFGDGATSANDFHAGLNFAGVFSLPVVLCCTNNQWAISQPVDRQTRSETLAQKGAAYGIQARRVDGTDFVRCYLELERAITDARSGKGPTLLEFVLYRMTPHSSSDDPTRYQAADWMERARASDPVSRLEQFLLARRLMDPGMRAQLITEAEEEVKAAVAAAEQISPPDPKTMTSDVFASPRRAEKPPGWD